MPGDAIARTSERDGIVVVTIDDGKANALSYQLVAELREAIARAVEQEAPLVLTGRPGCFCAGFDLAVMRNLDDAVDLMREGSEVYRDLLRAPIPVVTACSGHALAAGALLLLADDLTIAQRGPFKIGLNEVAIGLAMPIFAMTMAQHRLPPHRRGLAVLAADVGDPDQACLNGFVDVVVDDDVMGRALQEAARLRDFERRAFVPTKRRVNRPLLAALDELERGGQLDRL